MTELADLPPIRFDPFADGDDRLEALVRLRRKSDRRNGDAVRWRRSLLRFAGAWALVPFLEAAIVGVVSPMRFLLHLGLVVPWAVLVGGSSARRPTASPVDSAAGGVMLAAVLATLAGHRLEPGSSLQSLDTLAALPLVFLALCVRPRRSVTLAISALGILAVALSGWCAGDGVADWTSPVSAGALVAMALAVGGSVERELEDAQSARIRADIAAHSLTHRNDELRQLSEVDTLTGLANRRSIDRRLPEIAERSLLQGETIGVMMIDVDHFKRFNDRFGHQEGDRCLIEAARAAGEQVRRKDDLIGRFGGEEFLAVLPGAGLEVTMRVAERIRAAVESRAIPAGANGRVVTVSIGCAAGVVTPGWTIEDLLGAADAELYAAKRGGRNRVSPPLPRGEDPDEEKARAAA